MKKLLLVINASFCIMFTINYTQECCGGFCTPAYPDPITAYDFERPFNEKKYWLEVNERTGQVQICAQRLGIYQEFYRSPKIFCYPARQVPCPPGVPEQCTCWAADSVIVCYDTLTGDVRVIHETA